MRTTQPDRSSPSLLRYSPANREGRTTESFWIRRPTAALLVVYFIMVVGVGCILELEGRASRRDAAPSAQTIASQTDLVPIAERSLVDSSRPRGPIRSSHE